MESTPALNAIEMHVVRLRPEKGQAEESLFVGDFIKLDRTIKQNVTKQKSYSKNFKQLIWFRVS